MRFLSFWQLLLISPDPVGGGRRNGEYVSVCEGSTHIMKHKTVLVSI